MHNAAAVADEAQAKTHADEVAHNHYLPHLDTTKVLMCCFIIKQPYTSTLGK